jgi:restriction system protein
VTELTIPTYRDLLYPTLQALDRLNGSGTKDEVNNEVIEELGLSDAQLAVEYPPDAKAKGSKVIHRLAFARSSLKLFDAADNSTRGVWSLTPVGRRILAKGEDAARHADSEMRRRLRELRLQRQHEKETGAVDGDTEEPEDAAEEDEGSAAQPWRSALIATLLAMKPDAFERLCGRLLREIGFARVEVTGASNDEGIDGSGLLEVTVVSFPIYFQCKRYAGTVGPEKVRDFRGAMVGRGDKGLFITTGTFTPAAQAEAQRPGAPPIDLIDGDRLTDLLKEHSLGVGVELVESVTIKQSFFDSF